MIVLKLSSDTNATIFQEALDVFHDHRPTSEDAHEKGGFLVATVWVSDPEEKVKFRSRITIWSASRPQLGDKETLEGVILCDPGHEAFLERERKRMFDTRNRNAVTIGCWHTHPGEAMPEESSKDRKSWSKMMAGVASHCPRLHIIVAQRYTSFHLHYPDSDPEWIVSAIPNKLLKRDRRKS